MLCPDGSRGWLHKMTLGERVETLEEAAASAESDSTESNVDDDVLVAYLASRSRD